MKVLRDALPMGQPPAPVCLAIGFFDGVHLGHQAVIQGTREQARRHGARTVAVTFDRHPLTVVAPERAPALVYSRSRTLRALAALGLDASLVFPFDLRFSQQPAEAFVARLLHGFGQVRAICVGNNFVFGHGRRGDVALLQRLGKLHGFDVEGIAQCRQGDDVVSSSRLRERVAEGDWEGAAALMGRAYDLSGPVITGDRLGRQWGFPTANLEVTGLVLPPLGVYAAKARVVGESRAWPAAVNIGRRPTVDGSAALVRVEAHLLGFAGDLYGREVELELGDRLRGEQRFPSKEALVAQIGQDVERVRDWAGNRGLL